MFPYFFHVREYTDGLYRVFENSTELKLKEAPQRNITEIISKGVYSNKLPDSLYRVEGDDIYTSLTKITIHKEEKD